jgi:hypothetical protein
MATSDDVNQMLFNMLSLYNIKFDVINAGDSKIFEVPKFGVKVVYLDGQLFDKNVLKGWHIAYVHPDYDIPKARDTIVWGLVKGGYFHYLRHEHSKVFKQMLYSESWDRRMADERKRIYKDKPKYNYIRELMKDAEQMGPMPTLSRDSGFFDFIIE